MANYRYLTDLVESRNGESLEPRVAYELPALNWTMTEFGSDPGIPFGRVLLSVPNIDENMHRVIQAIENTSWFKP